MLIYVSRGGYCEVAVSSLEDLHPALLHFVEYCGLGLDEGSTQAFRADYEGLTAHNLITEPIIRIIVMH